ncbi:hypothetical protein [Mesorhizobium sp. L103C131B0]|uniref:hypothetical protein n=2 Tax=Mesorhizobium TaxID=68287 RepID=UPI0003CFC284|nr:hypothetical protein [Mesorhizobium sp. L103C131B0]ESZ56524.1 hypothetical protein X729_24330 [Mesorhizobium sp. L103C131B0]
MEVVEAGGEWSVPVAKEDQEITRSFVIEPFALSYAEGQRIRLLLDKFVRLKDRWEPDHQFIESARRSQLRAESQLDSLQSTIAETRRVLEASRKLLEKIAEREHHTQP